jgi:hypothetical protein
LGRNQWLCDFDARSRLNTILALSLRAKPSVVLLRTSSLRLETVGERVWQAIKAALPDLESEVGCVLVVQDERARVHALPLT